MIKSNNLFMIDKSYWSVENTSKWHQQTNSDLRHSSSNVRPAGTCTRRWRPKWKCRSTNCSLPLI